MGDGGTWIDLEGRDGPANMAIDLALLGRAASLGQRWLRLYRWSPHCLSFGRHEPALRRYDRGRIAVLGLDVVRRPTGGRAVWHGEELTYAVAAPAGELGELRRAYETIHRMLLHALQTLGVAARLAPGRTAPAVDAGSCFAAPVGGEIMIKGGKVVGSAQLRENGALLQHGSILLAGDQAIVQAVSRGEPPADGAASLADALGSVPDPAAVAAAVARAAAECWGTGWQAVGPPDDLLQEAGRLESRFRSSEWTWGN